MIDFLLKNGDAWAGEMAQRVKDSCCRFPQPTSHMAEENLLLSCGCQCVPSTHKINECNKNKFERSGSVYNQIPVTIYKKAKASKNLKLR